MTTEQRSPRLGVPAPQGRQASGARCPVPGARCAVHVPFVGRWSTSGEAAFGRPETRATLSALSWIRIGLDQAHDESSALDSARRHELTVHAAAYVEVALGRKLPLASHDRWLQGAAAAEGAALRDQAGP